MEVKTWVKPRKPIKSKTWPRKKLGLKGRGNLAPTCPMSRDILCAPTRREKDCVKCGSFDGSQWMYEEGDMKRDVHCEISSLQWLIVFSTIQKFREEVLLAKKRLFTLSISSFCFVAISARICDKPCCFLGWTGMLVCGYEIGRQVHKQVAQEFNSIAVPVWPSSQVQEPRKSWKLSN